MQHNLPDDMLAPLIFGAAADFRTAGTNMSYAQMCFQDPVTNMIVQVLHRGEEAMDAWGRKLQHEEQ